MSSGGGGSSNEAITVVVRCRPMNRKETDEKRSNIVDVDPENRSVGLRSLNPGEESKYFTFDATYDEKTQQRIFYDESCFNIIESALEGFNATIFAYGQTGCGKSFTMQGPSTSDEEMRGVIPNSFYHIFQFVKATKNVEFLIRCSYLELYNEEIRDLLTNQKNPPKCELKEDNNKGVYVKGLSDVVVESPDDLVKMFDRGLTNRTTASTNMNSESSRSHSVFSVVIEMSTKDETTGKDMLRVGKLNLVDLAGSERAKKTGAKDQVLKEGIKINLSLTALGNVISALSEGGRHIPYRDSKLTRLLQDSLGGSAKTMMVAAISPADYNHEETLSTLRYANRAKNIKNKPKINEDPKDTMIREFKAEIERLKTMLMQQNPGVLLAQLGVAAPPAAMAAAPAQIAAPTASAVAPAPAQVAVSSSIPVQPSADPLPPMSQPVVIQKEMTETGNYSTDEFVEASHSNVPSPNRMARTTASQDDGYGTTEFDQYLPENEGDLGSGGGGNDVVMGTGGESIDVAEIRDEIEQRIHQLEHMLVNNHDQDNLESTMTLPTADRTTDQMSMKLSPAKSEKFAAPAPTEEDLAREAESIREYKERKQRAKQKREEKAKREIQRVLDEKKMVEEELEELRMSSQQQQQQQQQQYQHTQPGTAGEDGSAGEKKLLKLKKKYEKRVQSLKEELDEVREDFAYQRKQLMDAVVEQEKDTRLYEAICRSLVTERDLQKLIEKCRYDEDRDEWIVPFAKKKNVDHWIGGNSDFGQGSMPPLAAGGLGGGGGGGSNGGSAGVGNAPLSSRSMLPDIGSSNASRSLVSASDLTDNDAYDSEDAHPSHGYADDGRGGHYPPQYSSRSEYNYGDENGDGNDGGGNGGNGGGAGGGSGSGLGGFSLPGIGGNGEKKKAKAKTNEEQE
eukprot:gene8690-6249_t